MKPSKLNGEPHRRAMLARAFLSQNVAIGCAFGAFGVSVLALQDRYDTGRAAAAMGISLVVLTQGLLSPVIGSIILRVGLRRTMTLGAVLSTAGYVAIAFAPSMAVVLTAFALLVGPGAAMTGNFPASLLAGGWYPEKRGQAVGIVNVPLFVSILPVVGYSIISQFGLTAFYLFLAGLSLLLVPVMLGVRDGPGMTQGAGDDAPNGVAPTFRSILSKPIFWLMVLGGGILTATSITGSAHVVPLAVEKGIPAQEAAILLSAMGVASMIGSVLVGVLCDKVGGAIALALAGFGLALSWLVLGSVAFMPVLIMTMLLVGMCAADVFPALNVLAAKTFGAGALPRVIGLYALMALPFTFLLPPAAGLLRDGAGSYGPVIATIIAACAGVGAIFVIVARVGKTRRAHAAAIDAA